MTIRIWWVRRDLRLGDNQALHAAVDGADQIVPVFVRDPNLWGSPYVGEKRMAFMVGGLRALHQDLQSRGSGLVVREGEPAAVLAALVDELDADCVVAEADVSPYARARDRRVGEAVPLQRTGGLTVHPPEAIEKQAGGPYLVYTPYSRKWKSLPMPQSGDLLPAPEKLNTPEGIASDGIPSSPQLPDSVPFPPGEAEARRRLTAFIQGPICDYADRRDRMDQDGTSRLSPYLRFGMLSIREAVVRARERVNADEPCARDEGPATWLDELIWREFYLTILYHFPRVRRESFRSDYHNLRWRNDEEAFARWQEGRTGYPVVDAGMRQLRETGWMHNRARMIVASFLTKDLLIDWRWGEKHFMQHLVDGDPASNNGGWQWSAGTGTDAAPYFRIFNPVLQGEKHDPEAAYVRRWVPELRDVPDAFVQEPWTMSDAEQAEAGCIIGEDYPAPVVDHQQARDRTLAAYKEARETTAETP
jgi:deoxyribodipyrimidine photo-lyase